MKKTFTIPLDRAAFNAARQRLVTQHLVTADIHHDHGKLLAKGVLVDYAYDGANLEITVEHKPAIYPEGHVESTIRDWFTKV